MILPLQPGLCGCPRGCADWEAHTCASCGLIILCIYRTPMTTGPRQIVEVHVPFEYSRIPDRQPVCTDLRLFSEQPPSVSSYIWVLLPFRWVLNRTIWPQQDPAGKTRRCRDRRKIDRLPEDQACPIRVGSLMSSASVSYALPPSYEYVPTTTRPAPHILLESNFSEYEEDRDLYDQLPEYDSDDFDYESLCPVFHPSQFVSPPCVSSTRASSRGRSKYTNPCEVTRLAIYPGPPRSGQRRRPGRALPCASRGAPTKPNPNPRQLHGEVGMVPPPRQPHVAVETDPPLRDSHVEVLAVPSRAYAAVGTDPLPRHAHVSVSTDSLRTPAHAAVGTDPLPRHAHVSVSTDSLLTLVHVALETDPPPRHAHIAVSTNARQAHVAVGTDPMPPHVAVQEVATSPHPLLARALEYQWRPARGRSQFLLLQRPVRGRPLFLLCR
ncbi:uncharacterized protein LOC133496666 isoform X2 [Syngnathoides biaculeatus]|uniref:uncharacterized protein LOC133496666 isoform X2 n=2 Tax=Syngnathoides biaculeatus TaxID=300417 RepID=UPI002ADE55B3|nr:uncharacterized protein LOC133496666 isoform X2 [Syngnathoides biaculeatus]